MNVTAPQFVAPYALTNVTPHVRVTLSSPSVVLNASLNGSFYFDRTGGSADLIANIVTTLNLDEISKGSSGVWTASQPFADHPGRYRLTRVAGTGTDVVTSITFPSSQMAGVDFGFDADTVTPDGSPSPGDTLTFTASYRAGRLYIPLPLSKTYQMGNPARPRDDGVLTSAPGGNTDVALFGSVTTRAIYLRRLRGAAVWQDFADDQDFCDDLGVGINAGDPNLCWDAFRQVWRDLPEDTAIRYSKDHAAPATFKSLQLHADSRWVWDTASIEQVRSNAGPIIDLGPITCLQV
jgi:hypothetical protein